MKEIKMKFDRSNLIFNDQEKRVSDAEWIILILDQCIFKYSKIQKPEGMAYKEQRYYYKIWSIFDLVKREKAEVMILSDEQYEFIAKCIKAVSFDPSILVNKIFDVFESAVDKVQ